MALIPIGNIEKYSVNMPPIGDTTLKSSKWKVIVTATRSVTIDKADCTYIDDDTYSFIVNTNDIGCGPVRIMLAIEIFDSEAPGGTRAQNPYFITLDTVVQWGALR